MARPIAKRKAGLLGGVASPDGGIDSLVLASGGCPVRFDLDHSLLFEHGSNAADRSVRSTQTNPPGAPPIHALPDYGEYSAASRRAFARSTLLLDTRLPEALRLNVPALRVAIGRPHTVRTPWHFARDVGCVGVLRLRSCFASRSGYSAQDDILL